MKKFKANGMVFLLFFLLSIVTIACFPEKPLLPATLPSPEATISTKARWEMEWETLTARARRENHLNIVVVNPGPATREFITKSMKDKYGIDVDLQGMPPGSYQSKIIRERKAGIFNLDILLHTVDGSFLVFDEAGILEPLDKMIFVPQVTDEKSWRDGRLFLDKKYTVAGGFQGINPLITVNTQLVKQSEIQSLDDLLNPRWKGQIVIYDPAISGPGNASLKAILTFKGRDYAAKLVEQNPTILRDGRLITEWLARGRFAVSIGPSFGIVKDFVDAGSPIAYVLPREGAWVTTSPGSVSILKDAPHPAAAKVFANWILTRDAQQEFSSAQDTASRRLDVGSSHLVPQRQPQPGVRYLYDFEMLPKHEELTNIIKEIFKPSM